MATYTIQAPDGRKIELEGPENATNEQLSVAAKEAYAKIIEQEKPKQEEPSMMAKIGDVFTGNLRETEQTQSLPYWTEMPEVRIDTDPSNSANWKSFLGTLATSPSETVQVIKANFPHVGVEQDEKGNYILQSGNGQKYAIAPGFKAADIPRAAVATGMYAPSAAVGGFIPAIGAAALNQAAIEGTQKASGGSFDAGDILSTAGVTAAIPVIGKAASMGVGSLKNAAKGANPLVSDVAQQTANVADNVVQSVPEGAVAESMQAAPIAEQAIPEKVAEDFVSLAKKAKGGGIGSIKAKEQIAAAYDINPEAKQAAETLGIDLPPDLLSDSRLIKETVGLSRSMQGTEASTGWSDFILKSRNQADDALRSIDASDDMSTLSETIQNNLGGVRDNLKKASKIIYDDIDKVMPLKTKTDLPNTRNTINGIAEDMGGIDNLSPVEKELLSISTDPTTTYGRLKDIKSKIGSALEGAKDNNPYGGIQTSKLSRLYSALADDQLALAKKELGDNARNNLRYANQLTAKRKALEKRMIQGFGKDGDNSIASKINSAISTASSKGDTTGLNKILKVVPKELHKETVLTGIMNTARTPRDGFSTAKYENIYQGLRKNKAVYSKLATAIGPDAEKTLQALYVVSKRINEGEFLVLKNGKSMQAQALKNAFEAKSFASKVMDTTAGRVVATAATVSGKVPFAKEIVGGTLDNVANSIANSDKKHLADVSKMLTSDEFLELTKAIAERGAEKTAASNSVKKLSFSPKFKAWANNSGLPKDIKVRQEWIRTAILSGKQLNEDDK